jgi:hypothetical protein
VSRGAALLVAALALAAGSCSGAVRAPPDGGADRPSGVSCTTDTDCASRVPPTSPPDCAVGTCSAIQGECVFSAKDEDGDGFPAFDCKSTTGVAIVNGADCNDRDPSLYPGHPEACSLPSSEGGSSSECSQGRIACLPDGSESPCQCVQGQLGCCGAQPQKCASDGQWAHGRVRRGDVRGLRLRRDALQRRRPGDV